MKFLHYILFVLLLALSGCKKDSVDGSSVKKFQESINDMATSLNTLQQTKFNEALYILKTFGVEGETDMQKLELLAKLINGKKAADIFAMADEVAKKHNIDWDSASPPSLGEMNIFQNISAMEIDPNDILASSLDIIVEPMDVDTLLGPKAMRIIPKLIDNLGNPVVFSNAGLETILEIYSNGEKLLTSKNLMNSNEFKGFYLKMSSLPADKIIDSSIDIKVSVKTTKKNYQLLKSGISVNRNALKQSEQDGVEIEGEELLEESKNIDKPENAVSKFLNNVRNQNLKSAYEISENPNWGSFDKFSDANTGFGGVKNINIKNISVKSNSDKKAVVNAIYQVIDREGNVVELDTSYDLRLVGDSWKITNYVIHTSEKQ